MNIWIMSAVVFIVLVLATIFVPYRIVGQYHQYVLTSYQQVESSVNTNPARVVVLGSGIGPDGQPGAPLAQRLAAAKELYDEGAVNQIVVSGYSPSDSYNEPLAMKNYLVNQGVPEGAVQTDPGGYDTFATCKQAKANYKDEPVVFVSQASHLDRAIYLCRSVGVEAYGFAANNIEDESNALYQSFREAAANVKAVIDVTLD